MYLRSLELFGFKSFAPKTVLTFHRGVTAIVGPNGCGKSNVLDAIRWVLGEQSAKALRGGEMADVIFSGTDSRAAVGMAEVSMNFAECEEELGLDWHEVTITRRVFRDGGSEYFLNKTPCRLKDIHQLFMDTGIGRSAYSIMEQGKIDMILSSRPEDRRAIFEEAAGITKYKAQKKEALRKLEATEANLLRLSDIIKEVKRQIGSLQRQAGKARRYQALLADLRLLETHSAKRQFDLMESQRETTAEELVRLGDRQKETEQEIDRQENEMSGQRAALEEMEQRFEAARQIVNDLKTRISGQESRIVFNREKAGEFSRLVESYRLDVAAAEEKCRITETQLHDTDTELDQITTLLASELRRMEEKQAATAALITQRQDAERALAAMAGDAGRIEIRISGLRGQLAGAAQQRDGAEARLNILSGDLEQVATTLAQVTEQHNSARLSFEGAQQTFEEQSAKVSEAEASLRGLQMALGKVENDLRIAQRTLSDIESKTEVLRQLNAGGEGFSQGTQAVLRGLDNAELFRPAVLGALAQFLEVPPEFVAAVEAALGADLQAIVTKDTMVAESIIKTLTAKKLGEASLALRDFAPAPGSIGNQRPAVPEGAIDWLLNKVIAQPEVAPLVERLLDRTLLVADLETALRLFPDHRIAMVTLRGEVLTGDGILHGGATGKAVNSVLERKNQIAVLEAESHAARGVLQAATSNRELLVSDLEDAQARLEIAREEKQSGAVAVSTWRGQIAILERELRETEKKRETLSWERNNSQQRQQQAADRIAAFEAEVASSLQQLESLQTRRAEAEGALEEMRTREGQVTGELNELKIKVATERQRHTSLHHQRQPMEARIVELNDLAGGRRREIVAFEERTAAALEENSAIEVSLIGFREKVQEAELTVAQLLDERANLVADVEEFSNTLRILRHQLSEAHDQRSRFEVRQAQVEMKLHALEEHIQKRYQLDLRSFGRDLHALRVAVRDQQKRSASGPANENGVSAVPVRTESAPPEDKDKDSVSLPAEAFDLDWERIDAMVRELDQRLDAMGPVNIDAIQEYDELEERYAFLEKQNTDLTNSKTELLGVIQKINATTKTLFADTFEKIRGNFAQMFVELFGGGKANLLLVDESDPLESGIDIIAKPPGKQLQSISLLSGGERTMTAVALLFSIYMVKPSPFCVLDEMDAPLDESNINRFIRILDRFVAQSQFVVISHNKRTIARADALYGVTMEEQGVSKLVGVRFTKREESDQGKDIMGTNNPTPVPSVAETFGKSGNLHSELVQAG